MNKKVHLELNDIAKIFRKLKRPAGALKAYYSDGPYQLKVVDYEASSNQFIFTAAGSIPRGVFPGAVKAAHLKELFEEAMLAVLRHSGKVNDEQWAPHLKATMTTKAKTPSGEIHFSGYIRIEPRNGKPPVVRLHCEVNPHVTYDFEGRIISNLA